MSELGCLEGCMVHSCNEARCERLTRTNRPYCSLHECGLFNCEAQALQRFGRFWEHTCSSLGCDRIPEHSQVFRNQHKYKATSHRAPSREPSDEYDAVRMHPCVKLGCLGRAHLSGGSCKRHKCNDPSCEAVSKLGHGSFCAANHHACVGAKCGKKRVGERDGAHISRCEEHHFQDGLEVILEYSRIVAAEHTIEELLRTNWGLQEEAMSPVLGPNDSPPSYSSLYPPI